MIGRPDAASAAAIQPGSGTRARSSAESRRCMEHRNAGRSCEVPDHSLPDLPDRPQAAGGGGAIPTFTRGGGREYDEIFRVSAEALLEGGRIIAVRRPGGGAPQLFRLEDLEAVLVGDFWKPRQRGRVRSGANTPEAASRTSSPPLYQLAAEMQRLADGPRAGDSSPKSSRSRPRRKPDQRGRRDLRPQPGGRKRTARRFDCGGCARICAHERDAFDRR